MWILALLAAAAADTPTVTLNIIDPTGAEHVLTGPLPLSGTQTLELGKASHRFDVRAVAFGEDVRVIGELHEVKGKKDKVVRAATLTLPDAGTTRAERISWGAPKGATVPDGLNPDLLAWRIVAEWNAPEEPAVSEEVAEETTEEAPETPEAPEDAAPAEE